MLMSFKVENYRSFRDEVTFDFEAVALEEYKECLIKNGKNKYLPVGAVYGKNGGGKSNLIRAFWIAVQFIKNAQRTQHENALIPVYPFRLNKYSINEPTKFEFNYVYNGVKYCYGFSATKNKVYREYLYSAPKGKKSKIFERTEQKFDFPANSDKKIKELISEAVAENQLFFSVSCTMNYRPCIDAMKWFREAVLFSRDYTDIQKSIHDYSEDKNILKSMVNTAKIADLGIEDITFEINNMNITNLEDIPENIPDDLKNKIIEALKQLTNALESGPNTSERMLQLSEIKTNSYHKGEDGLYSLGLHDESDGTRRLMNLAPAIEKTLQNGGIFIVDEIEKELHPILVEYLIEKFQDKDKNKNGAQLLFTTHNIEILGREILRRDQIYFVDKERENGVSEIYSLADYSPRKDTNIYKAYMLGKYGAIPIIEEV